MKNLGKVAAVVASFGIGLVGLVACGPDPEPDPRPIEGPDNDFTDDISNGSGLWGVSEMSVEGRSRITKQTFNYSSSPLRIDGGSISTKLSTQSSDYSYTYHDFRIYYDGSIYCSLENGLFSSYPDYEGYTRYTSDNYVETYFEYSKYGFEKCSYTWNKGVLTDIKSEYNDNEESYITIFKIAYSSDVRINKSCYRILNSIMLPIILGTVPRVPFSDSILSFGGYYGWLPNRLISEVAPSFENGEGKDAIPVLFEFNNIDKNGCPQTMNVLFDDGDKTKYTFKWIKL